MAGPLELGELVNHRRQLGLVAGLGAPDDHGCASSADRMVVNFVVVSVDFVVGIGFGDDPAARVRDGGAAVGRQLRAPDGHHPASVAALVAPAHRARVETAVTLDLADQVCGRSRGRSADRRGRMQRKGEIQSSR